jgi:hypothetical protein
VPTLWRKKDGGHYYIRAYIHGRGGFATYFVTARGVEWLKAQGVPTHPNGAQVASQHLKVLLGRQWATTGGSGLHVGRQKDELLTLLEAVTSSSTQSRLDSCTASDFSDTLPLEEPSLAIETGEPWRLALRFDALPQALLPPSDVDLWTRFLVDCRITTPAASCPGYGLQVWPGSDGLSLPVAPQEASYAVTPEGQWPAVVLAAWCVTVPGLASGGSLFKEPSSDGARLAPGTPLTLGSQYVLVQQKGFSKLLPQELTAQSLGAMDNWEAFRLTIPTHLSPTLQLWAAELGHPVRPRPWSLRLVSPLPHRFTVHGQPVVPGGRPLLFHCEPPGESSASQAASLFEVVTHDGRRASAGLPILLGHATQYVLLPPLPTGSYLLRSTEDWSTSLTLRVEVWQPPRPPWPVSVLTPMPIRVQVGPVTARAFEAPVALSALPAAELPNVSIVVDTVASRVRVSLYPRESLPRHREIARSDAPTLIRNWLARPAPGREAALLVDAGPGLGRATLLVTWPPPTLRVCHTRAAHRRGWHEIIVPALVRKNRIPAALGRLWRQQ